QGITVLLVEDDDWIAAAISKALKRAGVLVERTTSVAQAKERLGAQAFTVAVIDHQLGSAYDTGTTLAIWMQTQAQVAPILRVSFSGETISTILRDAPAEAFHDFISKPITAQAFVGELMQIIQRHRRAQPSLQHFT